MRYNLLALAFVLSCVSGLQAQDCANGKCVLQKAAAVVAVPVQAVAEVAAVPVHAVRQVAVHAKRARVFRVFRCR